MTLLKVKKRKPFPFQGRVLEGGAEIDSRSFSAINSDKWAQLIDHGFFELVDKPGAELDQAIADRRASAVSERAKATLENRAEAEVRFTEVGAVEVPIVDAPIVVATVTCPECNHVAKNAHGLKVHRGKKHPTKE